MTTTQALELLTVNSTIDITTLEQLDAIYIGWREDTQSAAFITWRENQPQYIDDMCESWQVVHAVIVLDNFYADTKLKH